MNETSNPDPERVLREMAKLLAPYVAAELNKPRPTVAADYDEPTCRLFVSTLGTQLLERSLILFGRLADGDRLSSLQLAEALDADSPRSIGGMLTSPLKRRARQLELPLPFVGGEGAKAYGGIPDPTADEDPGRTYWADRDGIAARMTDAILNELKDRPEARIWKFVWKEGDLEFLTPAQVREIKGRSSR